jgi:hypothetical protein
MRQTAADRSFDDLDDEEDTGMMVTKGERS